MMGGPIDLTPFGVVIKGIGTLYWLLVLGALALILWKVKGWVFKLLGCAVVLIVMVLPVALHLMERLEQQNKAKSKLDKATAQFEMRCKSSGEKIARIVENIDGIVWMKWRLTRTNYSNQFKLDDPYGRDCDGDACILKLLRVTKGADLNPVEANRHMTGYRSVESTDPADGHLYRYSGVIKLRSIWTEEAIARQKKRSGKGVEPSDHIFTLVREPIEKLSARYGVTWDDISTEEDRANWIAGSSLKVIDLHTNEVVGERLGYMMDRGQGSTAGFRSPWLYARANSCPSFPQIGPGDARRMPTGNENLNFILNVLHVPKGE